MHRKGIVWLYLFLVAAMLDIAFLVQGEDHLRYFSKPLIVSGLLFYFLHNTKGIGGSVLRKSVSAALIFSIIGDTLLLFPSLFLYGLGAFLMTHVCYIITFKLIQNHTFNPLKVNFVRIFFLNLPIYIGAILVYYLIRKNLQDLQLPVVVYMMVIVLMASIARERFGRTNAASFWQVFIGALLFVTSDAILALNRFYMPIADAGILIMGTYMMAQLLIVMGIRGHLVSIPKQ